MSPEKIILQSEKEHCAIFIHAHFQPVCMIKTKVAVKVFKKP